MPRGLWTANKATGGAIMFAALVLGVGLRLLAPLGARAERLGEVVMRSWLRR